MAPARADILAYASNGNEQVSHDPLGRAVDLSSADGARTSLTFVTAAADLVKLTFSAECAVDGHYLNWGFINIQVQSNGGAWRTVAPSGSDSAFCSGFNLSPGSQQKGASASMAVVVPVPAGKHQVRVQAGTSARFRLDDLSLIVED